MTSSDKIALRPVVEEDDGFLLSVYASTRAQEMAMVPWPPAQKDAFLRMQFAAQKQHYAAEYPHADHDIICVQSVPVGRMYLDRGKKDQDAFHILDITVLPEHRNHGAGTHLLRQIMEEAAQNGKSVSIHVENFSPSLRLFERLGFQRSSEVGFQLLMKWQPPA
ncbi:MAG TPA: GNAT family N-acetyltransferase [Candidatus Saccharimonadales bacterium]|jgi:ribosomal protein S18 acetylase RimI-like enzyme|nr:GNAT family N-acetyltransferase [Candidatus Saccharimonadales bacterium]